MLDKSTLAKSISKAFMDQRENTDDPQKAADNLAGQIADAIDVYVKQMTITYSNGLIAGPYPVVGTFVYTLS